MHVKLAALVAVVALAAAGPQGCTEAGTGSGNPAAGGEAIGSTELPPRSITLQLIASGQAWTPTQLEVEVGAPVFLTVTNRDGVRHSFTISEVWVDTDIPAGATITVPFALLAAGVYTWSCKYHGMSGKLTVR